MTIWKFTFPINNAVVIEMPANARILHVECQDGQPCLWALVDPKAQRVSRVFHIFGTGHEIDEAQLATLEFIATFQQTPFVWHLFGHKKGGV
jgi:hypothetical protein